MADKSISPIKWEHVKQFFIEIGNRADGFVDKLKFIAATPSWAAGQMWYDATSKCVVVDTGISGVRNCIGQENYIPIYNDTGVTITNGTPVTGSGLYVGGLPSAIPADADNINHVLGFFGLATSDILDGESGVATKLGAVHNVNTSALAVAPVFLASGGGLTQTLPLYPTNRLLIGGVTVSNAANGIIGVDPVRIPRQSASASISFTSQGVGSGTYDKGGFYEWSSTDANLTQASASVTHGIAGKATAAHVGIVPSGAGTVDTGQVGLRVGGTQDSETGSQSASQTDIITTDITTLTANVMAETAGKFSGDVLIEFYTVSGTPTAYSLDFNYGFSKYIDAGNQNSTLIGFSAHWLGGAVDSGFDIKLKHHKATGWTHASTGFVAGNGNIISRLVDQSIDGDVVNGEDGAWKRVGLDTYIESGASEGLVIEIVTTANNTIQTMDIEITGVSEELS